MTEEQEPIDPTGSPKESLTKAVSKKATKKVAKKATKKAAKKSAKKATKKATKKAVKKKGGRSASEPELALEIEEAAQESGRAEKLVEVDEVDEVEDEALAAAAAAEAAMEAARVAQEVAAKAALLAQEARKKAAGKKSAPKKKVAKQELSENEDILTVIEDEIPSESDEVRRGKEAEGETKSEGEGLRKKKEKQEKKQEEKPPPPPPEVPDELDLNTFRNESLSDLYDEVERLPVRIPNQVTRAQLVFTVVSCYATHGTRVTGEGVLEYSGGNFGMLRDELRSFRSSPDDLHVPLELIKQHDLREGQRMKVLVRGARPRDKYLSVSEVLEVEGLPISERVSLTHFDALTSLFPEERFVLEGEDDGAGLATRVVDLVAPLGKGQRGLIVAPPRGGKTILLKQIARAIQMNAPEAELVILLLDERPEEVTDFEEMVGQNVFASTFDEPSKRHAEVANLVLERSRRLVEQGRDVVILLDSLTRLARGYNNAARGGPIGSGGISPKAITETRKFFGAARNIEEGGSLTILATCLVETESRMDDVIFEELKGTGNMEVRLDRELAEQRIYPAIHIPQSGTRNDDRLYHPDELPRVQEIRRHLASQPIGEAIETLLRNLARTTSNTELLLKGIR